MVTTAKTLTDLIREWAETRPKKVAIREKRFGIWQTMTWEDVQGKVLDFSRGLLALGMNPGALLSVIGHNAPEWLIAEFAVMRLGGSCLGVYPDMQLEEVVYLINASDSRVVVAQDQEQADKLIDVWDRIKETVVKIVVWDSRGMGHYFDRHPFLIHMRDVMDLGRTDKAARKKLNGITVTPDATALILPTSGTTGLPKLAMIAHENMFHSADIYQRVHPLHNGDELFSWLPLPWMGEQLSVGRFLLAGVVYSFPEGRNSVKTDFMEIQPTVVVMSPRMYEDICSDIRARMEDASFFKKLVYNFSLNLALEQAERILEGGKEFGFVRKWLLGFFMFSTLRGLRQRVGLGRVRLAFTGGAAIGREVFTFFLAMGINLMQLYGMTENTATTSCHLTGDVRPETVGLPLPGIEIRIGEDGMIYVKSPTNFPGYYKNPEETAAVFQGDWFKTGDSGYFDEFGHLVVLDRQKDLMYLNDGAMFAPQELENRLKFSPYIREAVVFGDQRDFVTSMISIDMENVGNWANKRNIAYTTFIDLSQNDRVIDLIKEEIRKINERLPERMRIKRQALLPKELHPDDEELTRTRKVKRNVVNQRYEAVIEALYQNLDSQELDIQITYMDGKTARLKSTVRLEDL